MPIISLSDSIIKTSEDNHGEPDQTPIVSASHELFGIGQNQSFSNNVRMGKVKEVHYDDFMNTPSASKETDPIFSFNTSYENKVFEATSSATLKRKYKKTDYKKTSNLDLIDEDDGWMDNRTYTEPATTKNDEIISNIFSSVKNMSKLSHLDTKASRVKRRSKIDYVKLQSNSPYENRYNQTPRTVKTSHEVHSESKPKNPNTSRKSKASGVKPYTGYTATAAKGKNTNSRGTFSKKIEPVLQSREA